MTDVQFLFPRLKEEQFYNTGAYIEFTDRTSQHPAALDKNFILEKKTGRNAGLTLGRRKRPFCTVKMEMVERSFLTDRYDKMVFMWRGPDGCLSGDGHSGRSSTSRYIIRGVVQDVHIIRGVSRETRHLFGVYGEKTRLMRVREKTPK